MERVLSPQQQALVEQAERAARRSLRESRALDPAFGKRFTFETSFLLEDPDTGRWITETVARVDCLRVDTALRKLSDSSLGRPDRCARWLDEAQKKMDEIGVTSLTPREFLDAIGASMTVRTAVIYTGWQRGAAEDEVRAIEARVAPLYPNDLFAARQFEARDAVYRDLQAGPYAVEKSVAFLE